MTELRVWSVPALTEVMRATVLSGVIDSDYVDW
jgi:hypothetical protein